MAARTRADIELTAHIVGTP